MHFEIILTALQISADDIFKTFTTGIIPDHDSALDYILIVEKIDTLNSNAPMFKLINGVFWRRSNLTNIYDRSYTRY